MRARTSERLATDLYQHVAMETMAMRTTMQTAVTAAVRQMETKVVLEVQRFILKLKNS